MTDAPLVAVLDYGSGNVHSAVKALSEAGADARLTKDRGLIAAFLQMAIDAVGGDVELAVGKPTDVKILLVKGPVARDFGALDPVEPLCLFQPEGAGIRERPAVELGVAGGIHLRFRLPFGGDGIDRRIGHAGILLISCWQLL